MICNIVPLPKRTMCGSISTMQPLFMRKDALEDTWGFGCDYELDGLNEFYKYKTIERFGDSIVERIVYCKEPLLQTKKWWDCTIPIYPVWSKMYNVPFKPSAYVYRYLEGSAYLASCGSVEHPLTQTIFSSVYNDLRINGMMDMIEDDKTQLSEYVVPGTDEMNMSTVMGIKDVLNQYKENDIDVDEVGEWLGQGMYLNYLPDPYHPLFGKCPTANELKPLLSRSYLMNPIQQIPDPFLLNAKTDFNYDTQLANGTIQTLMQDIERSGYTDIKMSVKRTKDCNLVVESDMSVMYLGFSSVYNREDFVGEKNHLLNAFMSFASAIMAQFPNPIGVSLIKTWYEEIFIIIHINDKEDDKYFIDLAALSIGSPSFTDING